MPLIDEVMTGLVCEPQKAQAGMRHRFATGAPCPEIQQIYTNIGGESGRTLLSQSGSCFDH